MNWEYDIEQFMQSGAGGHVFRDDVGTDTVGETR